MIITLKLTSSNLVRLEETKILLPEDEVKVRFVSETYELGTIVLTVKKGSEKRTFKTAEEFVDITDFFQSAGTIDMEISKVIHQKIVKTWRAEPLILCETNHRLEAIPEIESLKNELGKIKTAITELTLIVKENEYM